jgi:hypothetical protein
MLTNLMCEFPYVVIKIALQKQAIVRQFSPQIH